MRTESGTIGIDLAGPLITLARELCRAETADVAAMALQKADSELDAWYSSQRLETGESGKTILSFGVEVRLPRDFEHQNERR